MRPKIEYKTLELLVLELIYYTSFTRPKIKYKNEASPIYKKKRENSTISYMAFWVKIFQNI